MRKRLLLGMVVLLAGVLSPAPARAQNTQDFTIKDFTADYYLDRNSAQTATLHTTESITAVFPSYDQNHGILRAIPASYLGHTVSLQIDSITDETGAAQPYSTTGSNGNLVLKIGDPNTYVHGPKTYIITYDQRNIVSILNADDEFYWDVNGDQWQQPFTQVAAHLHVAPDLVPHLQTRRTCYVGAFGATDSSRCAIDSIGSSGSLIITDTAQNLSPGETMTIVAAFNKGTFKLGPEIAADKRAREIKYGLIAAAAVAPALLSSLYLYVRWRRYGRDPKGRGVIIPEYQPYKGLNVLESDYIFEEKLNTKAISALIIELAIRKYLAIYEKTDKKRLAKDTKSYSLKLLKPMDDLNSDEKEVLGMFFKGVSVPGSEVDLAKLKSSMASDVKDLKVDLATQLTAAGFFNNNPEKAGKTYGTIGTALLIGGFFLLSTGLFGLICASIALAGLSFIIFGRYMPSRSEKGVEVHDYMLGLRDYIKLAEADRLKFLQSPEGAEKVAEAGLDPQDPKFRVKLFESLLPYAMVLGLEKDWAKQFADVYTSQPDWYYGNWSTFNAVYLASSLASFSSFNSLNFAPPRSSGGSGFGGGFAGGGGGGGGGGGW